MVIIVAFIVTFIVGFMAGAQYQLWVDFRWFGRKLKEFRLQDPSGEIK